MEFAEVHNNSRLSEKKKKKKLILILKKLNCQKLKFIFKISKCTTSKYQINQVVKINWYRLSFYLFIDQQYQMHTEKSKNLNKNSTKFHFAAFIIFFHFDVDWFAFISPLYHFI